MRVTFTRACSPSSGCVAASAVPTCSSKSLREYSRRVRVRCLDRHLAQIVGTALDRQQSCQQPRQCAPDERAENGDGGVTPVGAAFPRDRKKGVSDARAEVARRINRVAGGAAEGEADAPHETSDQIWAEARSGAGGGNPFREDGAHNKHKYEGADDLTQKIGGECANGRGRGEHGKFRGRVRCFLPVGEIVQPDDCGAGDRAAELRGSEWQDLREVVAS